MVNSSNFELIYLATTSFKYMIIELKTPEEIRAAFIVKKYSINKWAEDNGYSDRYVRDIIAGARQGKKAQAILDRIKFFLEEK